jgi:hypothetical protein
MLAGGRTIFLNTELLLPPVPDLRIKKEQVRELYGKLHDPGHGAPYENIDLQAETPTLSTRRENGQSVCRIGEDKILIQEDRPEVHVDEFVGMVQTVLKTLDVGPFFCSDAESNVFGNRSILIP